MLVDKIPVKEIDVGLFMDLRDRIGRSPMRRKTDGILTKYRAGSKGTPPPDGPAMRRELWDFEARWTKAAFRLFVMVVFTVAVVVGAQWYAQVKLDQSRDRTFQAICAVVQRNAVDTAEFARAVDLLIPIDGIRSSRLDIVDKTAKRVYESQARTATAQCESRSDLERIASAP